MLRKILYFLKNIFVKEKILQIEGPKEEINNKGFENLFKEDLQKSTNDRIRLLEIQKRIALGDINEENLDKEDVIKLKDIYYEQIIELVNSIEYYTKEIRT